MQGLEPMPAALNVLPQSLNQVSVQAQKFRTSATVSAWLCTQAFIKPADEKKLKLTFGVKCVQDLTFDFNQPAFKKKSFVEWNLSHSIIFASMTFFNFGALQHQRKKLCRHARACWLSI